MPHRFKLVLGEKRHFTYANGASLNPQNYRYFSSSSGQQSIGIGNKVGSHMLMSFYDRA